MIGTVARSIMVQGTGSGVGKSVVAAGICRILSRRGYATAPFKAQNMALNSFVTRDGLEMGRAQAVQAFAARVEPSVDMNPILIKPNEDTEAQVVVEGRPIGNLSAVDYDERKSSMRSIVAKAYGRLASEYEVVVIEGAGSPAEINLRENDLVNMGLATLVRSPVILVGDIDLGGVFASLVGTIELLTEDERSLVKGFVINKFRGDRSLLEPGLRFLEERTGLPVLGVVPFFDLVVEEEDAVQKGAWAEGGWLDVVVMGLPHISNFTDFYPLALERGVSVRIVRRPGDLRHPDLIIVPGTKNTLADFDWLERTGLGMAVRALAAAGTPIIGICGGYQMLGKTISDPKGVESSAALSDGLGLLNVETVLGTEKKTVRSSGRSMGYGRLLERMEGRVDGYEIHMGETVLLEGARPAFELSTPDGPVGDGAVGDSGLIVGTYLHGLFDNDGPRRALINFLGERKAGERPDRDSGGSFDYREFLDGQLDELADILEANLDVRKIVAVTGLDDPALIAGENVDVR
ncbi:MAG: cobyric acid synthase [Candidatus Aquicultorales bacterium]